MLDVHSTITAQLRGPELPSTRGREGGDRDQEPGSCGSVGDHQDHRMGAFGSGMDRTFTLSEHCLTQWSKYFGDLSWTLQWDVLCSVLGRGNQQPGWIFKSS